MKQSTVICLLLFDMMLSFSCRKEKEKTVATVHVRVGDRADEIEWMEVVAERQDRTGEIYIDAQGFNDERLSINLQNIKDTGTITPISISQFFFSDGLGFKPQQVQSGFIKIAERNPHRLSGTFVIYFPDNTVAAKLVKAEGSFHIFGHD